MIGHALARSARPILAPSLDASHDSRTLRGPGLTGRTLMRANSAALRSLPLDGGEVLVEPLVDERRQRCTLEDVDYAVRLNG